MKKIISVLMSMLLALGLVACGGKEETGANATGAVAEEPAAAAEGDIAYDDLIIRLTTVVTGEDKGTLESLVQKFNREYKGKITVNLEAVGEASFEDTVAKQLANNNNPPDFIMSHQEGQKSLVDLGLLQPFDSIMELSGITFDAGEYANQLSQYANCGTDQLYSVPSDAQSVMVLYNKDILAACGQEALPKNHTEMVSLCQTAKDKGYTPIAWSMSMEQFQSYLFVTALLQNGATLYNEETYYADWESNGENKQAFENALKSIRDLTAVSPATSSTADTLKKFLNNEALFYVGLPWNMSSTLTAYINSNSADLGIANINDLVSHIGGTSLSNWFALDETAAYADTIYGDAHFFAMTTAVTDVSKQAAICEFIRWFTQNVSVCAEWGETGHISLYNATTDSEEYQSNPYIGNYVTQFYPDIDKFQCTGSTPYFKYLRTYLGQVITAALSDSNTLSDEEILKTNQNKYNEQVDFGGM